MLMDNNISKRAIALLLIIAYCSFVSMRLAAANLPSTARFKGFFQRTQSVENLSFKLSSTKHWIRGLPDDKFREFSLMYGSPLIYRLIENHSNY